MNKLYQKNLNYKYLGYLKYFKIKRNSHNGLSYLIIR
jgi:hypothetical protein